MRSARLSYAGGGLSIKVIIVSEANKQTYKQTNAAHLRMTVRKARNVCILLFPYHRSVFCLLNLKARF
jgi:hypothetical protein